MKGQPSQPPDMDGDGSPNAGEIVAGTDPGNPSSVFRIQSISLENRDVILRWASVAGRTYRVQESLNLVDWSPVPDFAPLVVRQSKTDFHATIPGNEATKRLFRVVVSITPAHPAFDDDGDGSPDQAEIIAGTDPGDPRSWFRIESQSRSDEGMTLQWAGTAGRTYTVEESSNLSDWAPVSGTSQVTITITNPAASVTIPDRGAPVRFLRMKVNLTP